MLAKARSQENRKHLRVPVDNKAAVIHTGENLFPIMCTVTNMSEGGAGLTVSDMNGVPDNFELEIKGEPVRRSCRVAWKKAPYWLGVSFTESLVLI